MRCSARRWRFASLLVALLAAACTGLAGEPQIVATLPPPSPAPTEAPYPPAPPDLQLGASIYGARCAECHGISGAGDGALVQSGQVQNAGNFTEPDAARPQRPAEWHDTIANGRLERLMPPWRDALSAEQRWAVAMYTYTLHYSAEQIERGRAVYQAACADCHGERGRGDGPRAAELAVSVGDLTDQAAMAALSDETIYTIIAEGIGEGMPAFAGDLTEEEMRAAAAYTRTLSLVNLPAAWLPAAQQPDTLPPPPAATEEIAPPATVAPPPAALDIRGTVEQGTAGAEVPADLVLTLFVFAPDFTRQQFETTAGADGAFVFESVPFDADYTFIVTTAYQERIFAGEPTSGAALLDDPTLPLTIYELTDDPTVIEIARLVTQVNVTRTTLEVAQVFNIRNTSDRVYTTNNMTPDGRPISLIIPLPPGAIVPGFAEQGRYLFAADEFTVADTLPVLPGEDTLVQLVYLLEFGGGAIIEQELLYAVNGPVRLLVRPPDTVITSDQLPPLGPETLGASVYMSYGDQLALPNGGILRFEVSGAGAGSVLSGASGVITANNLLPIILVVIGAQVLIVGLLYLIYTRRRAGAGAASVTTGAAASPDRSVLIDGLIGQIAELDAEFEAGRLEETDYRRQRGVLKARLAQLMGSEDGG